MNMQSTPSQTLEPQTSAAFFLEGLVEAGIEYLFCNLGTDHATLIEEMAKFKSMGRPTPTIITCPHENVAIHMAGGYAAYSGKGQGVLVHVDAGTANAVMGIHNLMRARIPVLVMAGRSPYTVHGELTGSRDNYVHFVQDPFDMASLVRPYTKWEYNLPSGVVAKEVVRRAHSVMHSDPAGPVYLTLPRETLAEEWPAPKVKSYSSEAYGAVKVGSSNASTLQAVAQQLIDAQDPMLVTSYLGRSEQGFAALTQLVELLGIRVYEFSSTHNCMPRDNVWFSGFNPAHGFEQSDVGMLIDTDVPWLPKYSKPLAHTQWIHVDIDPIKKDFPLWGFATHTRIQADSALWLEDLLHTAKSMVDDAHQARVKTRKALAQKRHEQWLAQLAQEANHPGEVGAINPAFLCQTLSRLIHEDDIVVNEAIRHSPQVMNHIVRNRSKTLYGAAGGGLGYSGGMALGLKLAQPKARVIQMVGDGGFHFSTPSSVYAVAQAQHLPIFTVIFDNGGWQAVKEATLRVHPDGLAAQNKDFHARLEGEKRHFEMVGQAFGAHPERVEDPAQLESSIQRCLNALDKGQAAVLVVQVPKL